MKGAKCERCGRESSSLFIATHKDRGRIRICEACLKDLKDGFIEHGGCSCC